jgi:hypothetical protein
MLNLTIITLFFIAIVCMVFGLLYKNQRWGLLISVYEPAQDGNLLGALSIEPSKTLIFEDSIVGMKAARLSKAS